MGACWVRALFAGQTISMHVRGGLRLGWYGYMVRFRLITKIVCSPRCGNGRAAQFLSGHSEGKSRGSVVIEPRILCND